MNNCLLRLVLLGAMAIILTGCGKPDLLPAPPRPVLTSVLGVSASDQTTTYSGDIHSRYETSLGFRIPGKIAARLVEAGTVVKAGDVLARLDPADTESSAISAQAQLDFAQADVQRFRELRGKNFVSAAALDAKETAFKAAKAQANLARNQDAYTVLRADHAGVVESVAAEVGQVVAAGQPVVRLARTDELEVAIAIPESRRASLSLQQPVEIKLWSDTQARYKGRVRELAPSADAVTRTYAARIAIDQADAKILLGMTATVIFLVDEKMASDEARLSVPLTAVFQHDGKPALWLVDDDQTVALRPVTIVSYDEKNAVLSGDVRVGERYVVAGVHKLATGEKIKPVDANTDTVATR